MRRKLAFSAAVTIFAASLALPAGPSANVVTHMLPNGMKLIIQEDHDIPNVAMYFFFKIGSRNERPGITGVSHFFEHMMFNGSEKYGPKQFDIQMEKSGGRNNAYTSRDLTVYTDWFPSSALTLMMDMEADRIQNLSFDPKMVESERGVVASERRTSIDNSNLGLLYEQVSAAAYTAHPYGWPVIGWPSDIQAWNIEDLKSHYRMGYAPNNCVVVVVGDIRTPEVIRLATEYLGKIPRQDPPPPVRTVEPPQRGERRVVVSKPAQLPIQMYSFHIPKADDKDFIPLQVLGSVLTQGRSSRLYQRMVDNEQLAISVNQSVDPSLDAGQMIFVIRPRAGIDLARAEKAFFEEIEKVRNAEIAATELQKAKNQILTDMYRELKTIGGRANLIGAYEMYFGDYRKLFSIEEDVAAVTANDIQRVARRYLTPNNRTIGTLIPESKPATSAAATPEAAQ